MTVDASSVEATPTVEAPTLLPTSDRVRIFLYAGLLLLLVNFAAPSNGLIGLPVTFFLKNRLHLAAHELALFNLWIGIPTYLAFVFGFVRDRWSPFRAGDRGHLAVFGCVTAVLYATIAFTSPTYVVLLAGLLMVTASIQMVASAANGLVSTIGQQHAMAGQSSTAFNIALSLPVLAAALLGGMLSGFLEGRDATTAARILFLVAALLMAAIALFGASGPRRLFDAARPEHSGKASIAADIGRLFAHRPVYPALLIEILWWFIPATGTALTYHLANTLHASDAQVGEFYAIFYGLFAPTFVLYGFLCQRVRLSRLLFWGTIVGIPAPLVLLPVHSVTGAFLAAIPLGLTGGVAQAAFMDLAIRSCPKGLRGTMMMLVVTMTAVALSFGNLWGTNLYDHHGGFLTLVVASVITSAAILPVLLLVPRHLIATADGQRLASASTRQQSNHAA
ncbi:MAG TPA: MFS transporter [Caulobacteraceae bacterium]